MKACTAGWARLTHFTFHSLTGSTVLTRGGRSSYSLPFWMARLIHSSVAIASQVGAVSQQAASHAGAGGHGQHQAHMYGI